MLYERRPPASTTLGGTSEKSEDTTEQTSTERSENTKDTAEQTADEADEVWKEIASDGDDGQDDGAEE